MAYTSVLPVHRLDRSIDYVKDRTKTTKSAGSLEEAIDYALNREKTEQTIFEDAMGCTCENAYADMVKTKERFHKKDGVQGYHLVQSFAEGEVSPELAHLIGQELAEQLLKGQYEVVITTHLNTSHYHNHLVWNSVSMVDGKKYHSNAKSYFTEVRQISDQLCRKYGLSVIQTNQGKAMHYAQWKAEAEGKPTWRTVIRMDIREAIGVSFSWSQFCQRNGEAGLYVEAEPEVPLLKDTGDGAVYPPAFLGKRIWRSRNPGEDSEPKDPAGVWKHADAISETETHRTSETVLFLFIPDGGISKEAQADSLCSTFRYPEAGEKDLPNRIFTKGRDHDQGRTDSIPEALRRTGTFFDERAQGIIPESTGRYVHSGNQWEIKRTSKEDPLKSAN